MTSDWASASIRELASSIFDGPFGSALKTADYAPSGIRVARLENIGHLTFRDHLRSFVSPTKARELARHTLRGGDVLFSSFVDREVRVCLVPEELGGRMINKADCFCIRTNPKVCDSRFLAYGLAAPSAFEKFAGTTRGITRPRIGLRDLASFIVAVPPLAEQRRIVAKLDALTARLAAARAELERVSPNARRLRSAAAHAAFSGELTANWRSRFPECGATSDEALDVEFQNASGSRRKKPAAQIAWRPQLKLPPSWRWASVDQLVSKVQYGSSAKASNHAGIPVLRMGNVQGGVLDWTALKYLPTDHSEFPDLLLEPGDLLFNRTNSVELVGKSAVYKAGDPSASFASYLIRLKCFAIRPELLAIYLNSDMGRAWVESVASQQVGQANVSGSKLKTLGVPLPPADEQAGMLSLLEAAFARADRLEAEAARARALLDRLEAAILAKAFRGELVPQDPNDEPASVLLERIRAERAAAPKPKRGRRSLAIESER